MTGIQLDRVLARGRHATVWSARHDGAPVALKRWDDPAGAPAARERAVRRCVRHPNLLAHVPSGSDDLLLPLGRETLASAARLTPLAPDDLRRVARDVGAALAALHDAGWLHGDVAPTNVLALGEDWVLTDLDQAGPVDDPPRGVGTRGYAAPEVLDGGAGSVAADVHALAATLVAAAHGVDTLPADLRGWVAAALSPHPADRPTLADLLTPDVDDAPAAGPVAATPAPPVPELTARTTEFLPARAVAVPVVTTPRSPLPAVVALAGLALTLAATTGTGQDIGVLVQLPPALIVLLRTLRRDRDPREPSRDRTPWRDQLQDLLDAGRPDHPLLRTARTVTSSRPS